MNHDDLKKSFEKMNPTQEQKEKMLYEILNSSAGKQSTDKRKKQSYQIYISVATCIAAIITVVILISIEDKRMLTIKNQHNSEQLENISPQYVRKFMNYKNYRYEFMELEDIQKIAIKKGKKLGTLKRYITDQDEASLTMSLATTYALGGTVWELEGYSTVFRVLVEYKDQYYVCENVGKSDDSKMDLNTYFEKIALYDYVEEVQLYYKDDELQTVKLNQEESLQFLHEFSSCEFKDPRQIDFSSIRGDGYEQKMIFGEIHLVDNTQLSFRIELKAELITFGDNYYELSKKLKKYIKML